MALALHDLRIAERWGTREDQLLAICIAAGLIGFYVCGLFVHVKYLKILWFLAGFAAAHRRVVLTEAGSRASELAPTGGDLMSAREPEVATQSAASRP
jgi:hypothetical protein